MMRSTMLVSVLALCGCSLINDTKEFAGDAGEPIDASVDSGADTADGGADASMPDGGTDAGSDSGAGSDACVATTETCDGADNDCDDLVDEGVPRLSCRVDEDEDGFSPPGGDVVMACLCPDGRSVTPTDTFDCGDMTPDAFPGQSAYLATHFRKRIGTVTVNSFDYDCDDTEELQPLVSGMCRLGISGSCPAEEGPWSYDATSTRCGDLVEWARCETDCSSTVLGMQQIGCR